MNEASERNGTDGIDTLETIPEAVPTVFTEPPIEDQLAWHTLWPESHKLYGHGNELFSLCCDHRGELVASSCKVCGVCLAMHLYNLTEDLVLMYMEFLIARKSHDSRAYMLLIVLFLH